MLHDPEENALAHDDQPFNDRDELAGADPGDSIELPALVKSNPHLLNHIIIGRCDERWRRVVFGSGRAVLAVTPE